MKRSVLLFTIIITLTSVIRFAYLKGQDSVYNQKWTKVVLHEIIPMDNIYRKSTGCDSIEILPNYFGTKLEASFCYPNQWQFEKYRKNTVFIHDTTYLGKIKQQWFYEGKLVRTEINTASWQDNFNGALERQLPNGETYPCDKVLNTFIK